MRDGLPPETERRDVLERPPGRLKSPATAGQRRIIYCADTIFAALDMLSGNVEGKMNIEKEYIISPVIIFPPAPTGVQSS
ncbi:MAG: hypothetical protein Pg6C_17740 [Treponemataceae bacterium]|nr:MAG: hypothetical protein Pg6C_17740 [Treponemataceae bacterium]